MKDTETTETRCFDCDRVFRVSWLVAFVGAQLECPHCGSRRAKVIDVCRPYYIRTAAPPNVAREFWAGDTPVEAPPEPAPLELVPLQRVYLGLRNALAALDPCRRSASDIDLSYRELEAATDRVWRALTDDERAALAAAGTGQRD